MFIFIVIWFLGSAPYLDAFIWLLIILRSQLQLDWTSANSGVLEYYSRHGLYHLGIYCLFGKWMCTPIITMQAILVVVIPPASCCPSPLFLGYVPSFTLQVKLLGNRDCILLMFVGLVVPGKEANTNISKIKGITLWMKFYSLLKAFKFMKPLG